MFRTFNQTFESEQVFLDFRSSSLTSFFCNFWKVWIRTISVTSEISLFPNFLTQKQEIISKLFFANFLQFKKTGYFRKISELQKTNFSVTRKNKKFGNFRLTQCLSSLTTLHTTLTRHEARSYDQLFSTCGRGQLFFQATLKTNVVLTDQYWHHKA